MGRLNASVGTAKRNINGLESELRKLPIKIITITIKRLTSGDHRLCPNHCNCFIVGFFNRYKYSLRKAVLDLGEWGSKCNSFSLL